MKNTLFSLFLLLSVPITAENANFILTLTNDCPNSNLENYIPIAPAFNWQEEIEEIANKLWTTYQGSQEKLAIRIETYYSEPGPMNNYSVKIASFSPRPLALIRVNLYAMEKIKMSFPHQEQWRAGVAAILGHELQHALQKGSTVDKEFANGEENPGLSPHLENQADIAGNLMAMLAGYDTHTVYPDMLEMLYDNLKIPEDITQYPLKEVRVTAAKRAVKQAEAMYHVYQAARYYASATDFSNAERCYQAILDTGYKGPEIYLNLGVVKLMRIIYGQHLDFPFLWPVRLESASRLTVLTPNPHGSLNDKTVVIRLAQDAEMQFERALSLNPYYRSARLHTLVSKALQGYSSAIREEQRQSIRHYYQRYFTTDAAMPVAIRQKGEMVLSLFELSFTGSKDSNILEGFLVNPATSEDVRKLAQWNIDVLQKKAIPLDPKLSYSESYSLSKADFSNMQETVQLTENMQVSWSTVSTPAHGKAHTWIKLVIGSDSEKVTGMMAAYSASVSPTKLSRGFAALSMTAALSEGQMLLIEKNELLLIHNNHHNTNDWIKIFH